MRGRTKRLTRCTYLLLFFLVMDLTIIGCSSPQLRTTNTSIPSLTSPAATQVPVISLPQIPEITPSPSHRPTNMATITYTAIPTIPPEKTLSITIPAWLKSSSLDEMFMIPTINGTGGFFQISVINAVSQERVDIQVPENSAYFWSNDGWSINIIYDDWSLQTIDLRNGNVANSVLNENVLRLYPHIFEDNLLTPLIARGNVGEQNFLLVNPDYLSWISFDSKYFTHLDFNSEETPISVEDLETGEISQITSPDDGIYDITSIWSPTGDQLAIEQTMSPPQPFYWPADHIIIYDINQDRVISSFLGDFSFIRWSFDGQRILYQRSATPGEQYQYSSAPRILEIKTGESECYYTIKYLADSEGDNTAIFEWLPGDRGITYISYHIDHSGLTHIGNFCIYYFDKDDIICPTIGISDLSDRSVIGYSISPSGDYTIFDYDMSGPISDYLVQPLTSLIKNDGTGYLPLWTEENSREAYNLKISDYSIGLVEYEVLWRPMIP